MAYLSRRALLRGMARMGAAALLGAAASACRARVVQVEVEKLVTVDRPVTKIVTEVVRETVVVQEPPRVIERIVTPSPAPTTPVALRADVLDYGWTRLAQQMTSVFQETFPHITVEWRSLSDWRDYPDRVAILRASGQLGDLIESPSRTLTAAWAKDDVISDLTPIIEADGYDTGGLFPGALAAYRWRDRQVGLPHVAHGGEHVLLYDQDLFDQVGVAYPDARTTLADLTSAAEQIAATHRDLYGHTITASLPGSYPLLRAFGGELLEQDGSRCLVDEAGGRAFLHWLHEQVREIGAAPSPAEVERGAVAMWQAGRVAILRTSLRQAVALMDLQPERRIGVLPLPAMPDIEIAPALSAGVGYCVPATSRRAVEALQWIKFMLTREIGVRMFVEGYAEPGSRMATWQDPRVLDRFAHCAQLAEVVAQAERERVPANLATEPCYRLWGEYVARMLAGELSAEGAAGRIAAEIDALIGAPEAPPENGS
jgi:ABC-type glycerol-3-phosphate transport system substrate-binding protein